MSNKLTQAPSVLSYKRSIDATTATLGAVKWDERNNAPPVELRLTERSGTGAINNRLKTKKEKDKQQKLTAPTIFTSDFCHLPKDHDTLTMQFGVTVMGGVGIPHSCNDNNYRKAVIKVADSYKKNSGFGVLATRYAYNIASARHLFRNIRGARQIETIVEVIDSGEKFEFNAAHYPHGDFENTTDPNLISLADLIKDALSDEGVLNIKVTTFAQLIERREVFPSQAFVQGKTDKSRVFLTHDDAPILSETKIGNSIRTIDTWYPDYKELQAAIPIESYGTMLADSKAYRDPSTKHDFYTIFDNWVIHGKQPPTDQQHYVMAMFIRGGVFSQQATKG